MWDSDLICYFLFAAAAKGPVKKEDLDKELDKYMSSTKPNNLY